MTTILIKSKLNTMTKTIFVVHEAGGLLCEAFENLQEAHSYADMLTADKGYDHEIITMPYHLEKVKPRNDDAYNVNGVQWIG